MTEIEAKVSYVKQARSLKTYGVSFFLVKVRTKLSQWLDRMEAFALTVSDANSPGGQRLQEIIPLTSTFFHLSHTRIQSFFCCQLTTSQASPAVQTSMSELMQVTVAYHSRQRCKDALCHNKHSLPGV